MSGTRFRLFKNSPSGNDREKVFECKTREELEAKYAEQKQKYGATDDPSRSEEFSTDDNRFFYKMATGHKKDGKEIELQYSEMTPIPGGIMA